jgi:tRNA/rRNA methyltransferase
VLLIGYEWYQTGDVTPGRYLHTGATRAARKEELVNFFDHLEQELSGSGFFSSPEKKPSMIRSIRNCFQRMDMTEQEVRTFHGIVSALTGRKRASTKE